jgi:hypothetical protein
MIETCNNINDSDYGDNDDDNNNNYNDNMWICTVSYPSLTSLYHQWALWK